MSIRRYLCKGFFRELHVNPKSLLYKNVRFTLIYINSYRKNIFFQKGCIELKLQLAIDLVKDIPEAIELVEEVKEYIDVVELGTPVINREGLQAVKEVKEAFPDLQVLADEKLIDATDFEVGQAVDYKADIITVLGVSEDASIKGAVEEAKKHGKEILVDMIAVRDVETRAKELDEMGADYICVHTGYDLQAQGKSPFEDLKKVKKVVKKSKTAIAGGIKLETLKDAVEQKPDLIIVGGGIASADNPKEAARKISEIIKQG